MSTFQQSLNFGETSPADTFGIRVTSNGDLFDAYNLAVSGSNQYYNVNFVTGNIQSFFLSADANCTIAANSSGAPAYTINLNAGCPIVYYSPNCPWTLANQGISSNTTSWYVTVGSGQSNLTLRIVQNA